MGGKGIIMEDFEKGKKELKKDGVKQPALGGELKNPQKIKLNLLVAFYMIWRRVLARRRHKKYITIIKIWMTSWLGKEKSILEKLERKKNCKTYIGVWMHGIGKIKNIPKASGLGDKGC